MTDKRIFKKSNDVWWNKPLVMTDKGNLPAELVILVLEIGQNEDGVWINSRSLISGVRHLRPLPDGKYKTERQEFPQFVSKFISDAYKNTQLKKGCPDLVIWNEFDVTLRFVEVKCPKWDRASDEQFEFMEYAKKNGIEAKISEWIFEGD